MWSEGSSLFLASRQNFDAASFVWKTLMEYAQWTTQRPALLPAPINKNTNVNWSNVIGSWSEALCLCPGSNIAELLVLLVMVSVQLPQGFTAATIFKTHMWFLCQMTKALSGTIDDVVAQGWPKFFLFRGEKKTQVKQGQLACSILGALQCNTAKTTCGLVLSHFCWRNTEGFKWHYLPHLGPERCVCVCVCVCVWTVKCEVFSVIGQTWYF